MNKRFLLSVFLLVCMQQITIAQWTTNGANIYTTVSGNVGVGTTTPATRFHVKGTTATDCVLFLEPGQWNVNGGSSELRFGDTGHFIRTEIINGMSIYDYDNIKFMSKGYQFFATTNSEIQAPQLEMNLAFGRDNVQKFNLKVDDINGYLDYLQDADQGEGHVFYIRNITTLGDVANNDIRFQVGGQNIDHMTIKPSGQVVIGKITPHQDYKLSVAGKIISEGVKVQASSTWVWPDYVFKPTYDLRPLSEVELYIKANSHLPDVPSEEEVKKEGIDMATMDATLLRKVEELTLYLIEQNKQLEELKKEVNTLKEENKTLKKRKK